MHFQMGVASFVYNAEVLLAIIAINAALKLKRQAATATAEVSDIKVLSLHVLISIDEARCLQLQLRPLQQTLPQQHQQLPHSSKPHLLHMVRTPRARWPPPPVHLRHSRQQRRFLAVQRPLPCSPLSSLELPNSQINLWQCENPHATTCNGFHSSNEAAKTARAVQHPLQK
ncbi:hypothetical protein ACFX19_040011 [Malus domestica]